MGFRHFMSQRPFTRCLSPGIAQAIIVGLLAWLMGGGFTNACASPAPKIVVLEFHGMKAGVIADNLEHLPNFRELIRGHDDTHSFVHLPRVLTTMPAASQPAVTSMYTGLHPQRTGVVGNIWLDRRTAVIHTLISYGQQRINRILRANGVESLFDVFAAAGRRSMTSMLMLTNGADWSTRSGVLFWGNSSVAGVRRNGRWIPDGAYVDQKTMQGLLTGHLTAGSRSLTGVFEKSGIIPDLMVIQLLGIDLHSHYPMSKPANADLTMDGIQRFYTQVVLDPLIGELIQALKEVGCYERTIFFLVSDHGFSRIEKRVCDRTVDRCLNRGFRLPGWFRSTAGSEAVIMPGAGTKEIYLKNRCTGSWLDAPRILEDVKPAVDLLMQSPEVLDSIESLLVAQYPGEGRQGLEETDAWWVFDWRTYGKTPQDPADFLSCLLPLSSLGSQFDLADYLATGLRRQYTRWTLPDIKLVTRRGVYFERDGGKYAHHGSFYPDDCFVSFWVAGPGLKSIIPGRHVVYETGSTLDLVPMVSSLAHIDPPQGIHGRNPLADLPIHPTPRP